MARRGGYSRSTDDEWIKTNRYSYAEAIQSARDMGQELEVWLSDAIAFHSYRCEAMACRENYFEAQQRARAGNNPEPLASDYQPRRAQPTITRPQPGMRSARGPAPRR